MAATAVAATAAAMAVAAKVAGARAAAARAGGDLSKVPGTKMSSRQPLLLLIIRLRRRRRLLFVCYPARRGRRRRVPAVSRSRHPATLVLRPVVVIPAVELGDGVVLDEASDVFDGRGGACGESRLLGRLSGCRVVAPVPPPVVLQGQPHRAVSRRSLLFLIPCKMSNTLRRRGRPLVPGGGGARPGGCPHLSEAVAGLTRSAEAAVATMSAKAEV